MKKYIELIRLKHWIKNFLVFIPIICADMLTLNNIGLVVLGFLSFSFLSSFIYIINDIRDIEKDRLHPRKKNRPLPSGKISKTGAIYISIIMFCMSFIINYLINGSAVSLLFLLAYMVINILYSYGLKNFAILDVIILAAGFILRVYYGASIIDVEVSSCLFLTILNASLFLGLGKRKKELSKNKEVRKVLEEYNEEFLDKFQYLTLGLMLVFYSLWTMEQNIKYCYLTIPLIMMIFMKYCLIIEKSDEGDPTTIIYQDRVLMLLCGLYGIIMITILAVL